MKKLIKQIFNHFFWGQHPDAAIRYTPVISEIKKRGLENSKILEIGPGSTGIVPYLKRKIDGVDIDFSGPQTELLKKIKAKGVTLPFHKNSYDVVISVDVLEHLKGQERTKSIAEMLRVAKKLAIIICPIGELSQKQDKELKGRWDKFFNQKNLFLTEHVQNGLPKSEEILVTIDKEARKVGKKVKVKSYPNLNLQVRKLLMYSWITKSKLIYYSYLKGYLLFLPVLKLANFGNCYRRVFVIELAS
ncbi:MAG TPA: methyltransferase domain-containing protein [Candidatus Saccharimonadales bacterium]|nr:methyltransferase domain-containing protein [Candidatus Saccharimonadales bacterium]